MASEYDTSVYKKLLLHFMGESDPLYSMLQWLTERMMEVGAELGGGAAKGKHAIDRKTHFSGQGQKEDSA
jgi:cephalosporin-C deacetylase-like acetyl esterase